jgi:DNA-binding transcriptional MerR regulator
LQQNLLTIGRLSKQSGTPVKTIRYYDEAGILSPSATSDAGYRLYTRGDAARLESIRMLRELGFPIAAIREMLGGKTAPQDLLGMQLDVTRTQMRALRRQTAILEHAIASGEDALRALHLAHAAASLGAAERTAKIDAFLEKASGKAKDGAALALRASILDCLPETLTPEQLEAWLALHALLEDRQLLATLERQRAGFASPPRNPAKFSTGLREILRLAAKAHASGKTAHDAPVRKLAIHWAKLFADAFGKTYDAKFVRWFVAFMRETNDPRIEEFWRLVSILHARPAPPAFTAAQAMLVEALHLSC